MSPLNPPPPVMTAIAQELAARTSALISQLETVSDRLDLHRLELAANARETAALHLHVDRLGGAPTPSSNAISTTTPIRYTGTSGGGSGGS